MPRTREEIIAHADELAKRLEDYEPKLEDRRDPLYLQALRAAVQLRAEAEQQIADAVAAARGGGYSWALIGAQLGTSGQAARERFSSAEAAAPAKSSAPKASAPKKAAAKKTPAKKTVSSAASVRKIVVPTKRASTAARKTSLQPSRIAAKANKRVK